MVLFGFIGIMFLVLTLINVVRLLDHKLLHGDGGGIFLTTSLVGFILSVVFFCSTFARINGA